MRNFKIATVFFCLVSASILLSSAKSYGDGLPPVKGPVILTVSGKITNTNKDGKAEFDREGLESLGMTSFTTSTPWFKQPVKFEGVYNRQDPRGRRWHEGREDLGDRDQRLQRRFADGRRY